MQGERQLVHGSCEALETGVVVLGNFSNHSLHRPAFELEALCRVFGVAAQVPLSLCAPLFTWAFTLLTLEPVCSSDGFVSATG